MNFLEYLMLHIFSNSNESIPWLFIALLLSLALAFIRILNNASLCHMDIHKFKIKSHSSTSDYYVCSRSLCNHSKTIHQKNIETKSIDGINIDF